MPKRKRMSSKFKAKVAMAALKGEKPMAEMIREYGVDRVQIQRWKKIMVANLDDIFSDKRTKDGKGKDKLVEELYGKIGQLKVEVDWLKKKSRELGALD